VASANADDITALLKAWGRGDSAALERLTPLVYDQLRAQARRYVRMEQPGLSVDGTGLVHEVYLRLVRTEHVEINDRAHFFALSARLMRRILVDAARTRAAVKRGGELVRVDDAQRELDRVSDLESGADSLCALDDALTTLARLDPRRAQVIELRFFGGLSVQETADALGVSSPTVLRDWRLARAWLARELRGESA
jgi:RNA polymerase sigma-70 factor, ECF subfamily